MLLQYLFSASQTGISSGLKGTSDNASTSGNGSAASNQQEFNTALQKSINKNSNIEQKQSDKSGFSSNALEVGEAIDSSSLRTGTGDTANKALYQSVTQGTTAAKSTLDSNFTEIVTTPSLSTEGLTFNEINGRAASGNSLPEIDPSELPLEQLLNNSTKANISQSQQALEAQAQRNQDCINALQGDGVANSLEQLNEDLQQAAVTQTAEELTDDQTTDVENLLTSGIGNGESGTDSELSSNAEQEDATSSTLNGTASQQSDGAVLQNLSNGAKSNAANTLSTPGLESSAPQQSSRPDNPAIPDNKITSSKSGPDTLTQVGQNQLNGDGLSNVGLSGTGQGTQAQAGVVDEAVTKTAQQQASSGLTKNVSTTTAVGGLANEGLPGKNQGQIPAADKPSRETLAESATRLVDTVPTANKKQVELNLGSDKKLKVKNADTVLLKGDSVVMKESDLRLDKF